MGHGDQSCLNQKESVPPQKNIKQRKEWFGGEATPGVGGGKVARGGGVPRVGV